MQFEPDKKYTGTVKFYNRKNKFGFIRVNELDVEIYTKASYLIDPIDENDKVSFIIKEVKRGPVAFNVSKLEE
ncbi:MAG TPA: cold-shock protein [Flavobacteriales bacterium]|nr:cold-shock protein [Flavobacteriales bacterium]|tara:strand:+ start:27945 stop:28163 length:219 start_codon:yes stop_codon:yes gene_type:complete